MGASPGARFQPYIPSDQAVPEFSFKAVVWGAIFGVIFGAVTVYLGLRAGLTVSASIPIAVLSISILRWLGKLGMGRPTILENNIVQTTGSAGESVAAGVVFTIPALLFLGFRDEFEYWRIFFLALTGGWLGVLFMIPLRRYLIVKEHGVLKYPEGKACADVLVAGEKGGSFAGKVFSGFGLGIGYKLLNEGLLAWRPRPAYQPGWYPGSSMAADVTPEYLGVGYIIGPRVAGTIFAGGVLSWLVLIPLIKFFGQHIPEAIFPATLPIADLTPAQIWSSYIRSIGAGAVAAAGTITLGRTMPTIVASFRSAFKDLLEGGAHRQTLTRVDRDMPLTVVAAGSFVLMLAIWGVLNFLIHPGHVGSNLASAVLLTGFGFIFVTVSSRIVGLIGSSANPISGMTIATLIAVSLIFLAVGWTGGSYAAVALSVGAVVCIAAANAGATSQDLKTGFLVGATPWKQQVGLMVGVTFSVLVIGGTMLLLNRAYTRIQPAEFENVRVGEDVRAIETVEHQGRSYLLVNVIGSARIPDGAYLLDEEAEAIRFQEISGIGSRDLPAPQATLMATVINGILTRRLQWGLVLFGIFIVVTLELCGVKSLAFAVGSYLPISTTAPIFAGGLIKYAVEKIGKVPEAEAESGSGALFAAGLIAGGSIGGLILASVIGSAIDARFGYSLLDGKSVGTTLWPSIAESHIVGLLAFAAMAGTLFLVGRKRQIID
jgi:putative OPT family oligopeptide transporter